MSEHGYDEATAAFYDAMAAEHAGEDLPFYRELAGDAEGPVLELAVGTGRIYLEVLADGVDADGVDVSPAMLSVLRDRAADRGLEPTVWEGDMTALDTDRRYDLVYCPFNAFQHAYTVDDQQAAMASVYDALAPGGRFVFDVFVPNFDLIEATYGEWQTETITVDGVEHELRSRSRFVDEPRQIVEVENELVATDGGVLHETSHQISHLPYQQVELLARHAPFESWSVAGGFDGSEPSNVLLSGAKQGSRDDRSESLGARRSSSERGSDGGDLEDGDTVQVWTLEREA